MTYTIVIGARKNLKNLQALPVFVYVEVLHPIQPNGVMSSVVSLPKHTFTWEVYSYYTDKDVTSSTLPGCQI